VATHPIDNLRHGAAVYSSDRKKVGTLHAIVVDPESTEVTHLAVNAGPHFPEPGFGAPEIVNVDIKHVRDATEDSVELGISAREFDEQPLYEYAHFFEVPDEQPQTGISRLWNAGLAIASSLASLGTGIAVPAEHFRKARFERHILNDAPVWRIEPNTHIGDVERVIVNEDTDEIEALVIKRGILFHHDVVLPIRFVTEIRDGLVHAQIGDDELDSLEEFEPK
jgi:sporulation protein YlmC with PRC-barrel domain